MPAEFTYSSLCGLAMQAEFEYSSSCGLAMPVKWCSREGYHQALECGYALLFTFY